jgi:hypothetical protein
LAGVERLVEDLLAHAVGGHLHDRREGCVLAAGLHEYADNR